ncbi:MAG: oligosaccharide flippase family protein [Crocinitomicaceae bacterium]|nr:oligosaccharide flippase family protein [Crocinitomicaceae bacterium]
MSNNTQQTLWVLIGSFSSFVFVIASSMLLSRYFNKDDYGTYKQVLYIYSTILVVFTLGLPKAYSYFLPRVKRSEAKDLISKLNYILLLLGAIMSALLFFGAETIGQAMNNENLIEPLKYFSLVPFFMLPTMGLEGILATYNQTKFLAFYDISTKLVMLLCVALPVVIFKGSINSAIIGFTLASFFSFVLALLLKNRPVRNEIKEKTHISYKEIFSYTIPLMGATLWGIIITSSDQFFISRFFGNEVFADFANGSLEIPFVGMVISASSIVLAPIFSKKAFDNKEESKQEILELFRSVFTKTVKIVYPIVIFCLFFSEIIMMVLYGEKYQSSGQYFQIKLVVNFFTLIAFGPLILSIGGHRFYYKVHMYGAIILVILETISVYTINSAIIITIISVICQIGRIIIILAYIAKYFKVRILELFPLKLIFSLLIPSIIILFPLKYFLMEVEINIIATLAVSGIVYIILFSLWVKFKKIDYYSIVKPIINKIGK